MNQLSRQYGTYEKQEILLSMIKDIDLLFVQNDIAYSLCGGTLLGAVRENGFIPWDDDIDIMVNRQNYNKIVALFSCLGDSTNYCLRRYLWIDRIQRKDDSREGLFADTIDVFVILCYIMPGDKRIEREIERSAQKLSSKYSTRIIYMGRKEYKRFQNDGKDMIHASPEEFLGYFMNAKIVLTNSFHGTAFSIIFQKDFYSFVNNNLSSELQLGSRLSDLLKWLHLSERCISDSITEINSIDYEETNRILNALILQAQDFLHTSLYHGQAGGN